MAQPFISMYLLQLNKKLFKVIITFVTIVFLGELSNDVFTAYTYN